MPTPPTLADDRFDPAVRIVDYDAAWPARAAGELELIAAALGEGALRSEHIGSTAVPGLAAKPILDFLVAVVSLEPEVRYAEPLERLGYLRVPDAGDPGRRFFARPPERARTHHVHVVAAGAPDELRHLALRDYLRAHRDEAERYAALKRELVARHGQDRATYIAGKEAFMVALERAALTGSARAHI